MQCISWNVNGLRALMKKNFMDVFHEFEADFFCLQETKLQAGQIQLTLPGYHQYWHYAEKKGYSGTAIFAKKPALSVQLGMGEAAFDQEGRLITLEYPNFFLVTCYTPNTQAELRRLPYRLAWEKAFLQYLTKLKSKKSVIICGDLNVAHEKIDLKNWQTNQKNAGFTPQERAKFTELLQAGFIDTYRFFYPEQTGVYSWWNYRFQARKNNAGWRIDYFLVSESLKENLIDAQIYTQITGSDHCPVGLTLRAP